MNLCYYPPFPNAEDGEAMAGELTNHKGAELAYAKPLSSSELSVTRDAQGLRFELGPMSTSLLVARIVPWAVCLGLVFCVVLLDRRPLFRLLVFSGMWIPTSVKLWMLCKHRHIARTVGVADGQVFYSDDRTQGVPMGVKPREVTALRVYRSWWRPWIFELTTVPVPRFLGISATNPVILLRGLDWRLLDYLRWELSVALGLEKTNQIVGPTSE